MKIRTKDTWFIREPIKRTIKRKVPVSNVSKEINKLGRAIASPVRSLILQTLAHSPKSVGQLTNIVGISQPGISKQLDILKSLNFVDGFKDGRQITYKLNRERIIKLLNSLSGIIRN